MIGAALFVFLSVHFCFLYCNVQYLVSNAVCLEKPIWSFVFLPVPISCHRLLSRASPLLSPNSYTIPQTKCQRNVTLILLWTQFEAPHLCLHSLWATALSVPHSNQIGVTAQQPQLLWEKPWSPAVAFIPQFTKSGQFMTLVRLSLVKIIF